MNTGQGQALAKGVGQGYEKLGMGCVRIKIDFWLILILEGEFFKVQDFWAIVEEKWEKK